MQQQEIDFCSNDKVETLKDIVDKFEKCESYPSFIYLIDKDSEEHLTFCYIETVKEYPIIVASLIINKYLFPQISKNGKFVKQSRK